MRLPSSVQALLSAGVHQLRSSPLASIIAPLASMARLTSCATRPPNAPNFSALLADSAKIGPCSAAAVTIKRFCAMS
ncbi:hypothetical protein D3C71_1303910 [compost metagenome]